MATTQPRTPKRTRSTVFAANVNKFAKRSPAERIELLKRARILDAQGEVRSAYKSKSA